MPVNDQLLDEIRDLNLSYLILAQAMVRQDRAEACFRLGLSLESADRLAALTSSQLARIATANQLLCRMRFDDDMVWDLLSNHGKSRPAAGIHAAIVMAGQYAEAA
jgi:flagellar transcriptional activator FlhD